MTWGYSQQPPDSTGKKILTYIDSVSGVDYHAQAVVQRGWPTFQANTSSIAIQTTASLFAINNLTGSGLHMHILRACLINVHAAAYAGALCLIRVFRGTGTVTGSASQLFANDTGDTVPASTVIGAIQVPTSLGTGTLMEEFMYHTASVEAAAAAASIKDVRDNIHKYGRFTRPIVVRPGEYYCINSTTADATASVRAYIWVALTLA